MTVATTALTLTEVTVTALLATEPDPPAFEAPLDWLLLTNLTVDTPEQAIEKLSWYLCRWQIEIDQPFCLQPCNPPDVREKPGRPVILNV